MGGLNTSIETPKAAKPSHLLILGGLKQITPHVITEVPKAVKQPIPFGNGKYIKVCNYRSAPYVNIRDYAKTSSGQLYATKRGILLKPEEWKQLKKAVKEVDQDLKKL